MKLDRRAGFGCRNCFQLIRGGEGGGRRHREKRPTVRENADGGGYVIRTLGYIGYNMDARVGLLGSNPDSAAS